MDEQNRIDELEKRVEKLSRQLEETLRRFGDRIEGRMHSAERNEKMQRNSLFWGIVFIAAGVIWFGNEIHGFAIHIPFWPAFLIVVGAFIIFNAHNSRKK